MKKSILFPLLFVCFYGVAQKSIFSKAKVNEVDVYRNVALLKNTISIHVPKGNSKIVVSNISDEIVDETIQVGAKSQNISIISSQYNDEYESDNLDKTNPRIKQYLDSLTTVKNNIKKVNIELESTKKAVELLDKNQSILVGSNTSTVTQLANLTSFYEKKRVELLLKVEKLKHRLQQLNKDNSRISNSLKKSESLYDEEMADGFIILKINSKKAGTYTFSINYLAEEVSWHPLYEVRANSSNESLDITLKASIEQYTGLSWENVKLSLISSRYKKHNTAPNITPWILSYRKNKPNRNNDIVKQAGYKKSYHSDSSKTKSVSEVVVTGYRTNSNMLNSSYETDRRYTILSGDDEQLIDLESKNIKAEFKHYTVPSMRSEAFLVANIKDYQQYDFINAKAKIILDGMYVGNTRLNPNQTENDLKITLGSDPRISVKKLYVKKNNAGKFLSSNNEKIKSYDILISNRKKESITIEIKDRYPISEDKDIKVELIESSRAKIDKHKHILTWNKKIKAGEKIKLRVSYKIKHPKDYIISKF